MASCTKCPKPAVLQVPYAGTALCEAHFLESFHRRAKLDLSRSGRLPEGRIAVALSGGKDSVSALHFLAHLTKDHPRIELAAVTVDEGIAGYRDSALPICRTVTEDLGIPWHVVRVQDLAGYTIDAYAAGASGPGAQGQPRPACGSCGVFRRLGMNRLARDLGAKAIVTGHNLDDQAQSILMNHLKGDLERLARLAPHDVATAQPGLVPRLMPFRTIPEKEVLLYAYLNGLPLHHEAECPYAARSGRFALRDMLMTLEARTPGTRHALVRGQERLKPILQQHLAMEPMQACSECGEPTSASVCKACQLGAPSGAA